MEKIEEKETIDLEHFMEEAKRILATRMLSAITPKISDEATESA